MKAGRLLWGLVTAALVCGAPVHAQVLRWAAQDDVLTLDPHSQNHATTISLLQHAYEGLTRYGRNFEVEPALATGWESISPTHWRFRLRRNVRFHDGSAFAAQDVVFSFQRIRQPQGTMQIHVAGIREVKAVDEHTVDFVLEGPNPILLRQITSFPIMSKAWAQKNRSQNVQDLKSGDTTFASHNANGTGSYIIKSWEPDKRIVLARNPQWWDKADGNVAEVVYLPIKADATRVAALLSGEVDLLTDVPTQDVERLRSTANLKVLEGPENRVIFIGMDQHSAELKYASVKGANPFKDVRVRRALNLAVDREAIRRVTMRGLSIPAGLMVTPGVNGYAKEIDLVPPVDPEGAKRLLAEAGYPGGFEFTLDCPNNRYVNDAAICQALVAMWARAGLRVKLNAMPFATYMQKVLKMDSSAYMLGWGIRTFDALYMLQSVVRTKTSGADGSINQGRISDPTLDGMIDAIKTEMDPTRRNALIRDALVRTRDQHYYVPLHYQLRPWAMKRNVTTVHRTNDAPESRFARIEANP
jgi:peptide/nickel transport system substrate-binding protein